LVADHSFFVQILQACFRFIDKMTRACYNT